MIWKFPVYDSGYKLYVWVPEEVGRPGRALVMVGASVGGGVAAADVVVLELEAAFLSDTGVSLVMEEAPAEVVFLTAELCICSETSGQEPLE